MGRILSFALVSSAILAALHYWLWARLVRDPVWPAPWKHVLTILVVVLGVSLPLSFWFGRRLAMPALVWAAYIWMGCLLLLLMLLVIGETARVVALAFAHPPIVDPARRLFLRRLVATGVAAVGGALGAAALARGLSRPKLRELEITLDRLPRSLDGTSIVQLTDVHVGPTIHKAFVEDLVTRTNALHPDLVVITGDLVDAPVALLRDQVAPLAQLRATHGVYFVTGNHEYYAGVDEWLAELARLGIRVLRNERVAIGRGDESFDLAGVDDHSAHTPGHGADVPRALDGRDPSRECVLLAHQPRAIHEAKAYGVGLQLSGHTHGGQIWPWNYLVKLQQPYVAGLAREGRTQLYVSSGTGYWGPPMRLGTTSELTRIVLRAPAKLS